MTNLEMITISAITEGLFTEEEATEIFASGRILPLFTYAQWKNAGYQVKKGEHASLKCKIWKATKGKKKQEENEETLKRNFILVNAAFFLPSQVEKIQKAGA